jgi:hypothetical protein
MQRRVFPSSGDGYGNSAENAADSKYVNVAMAGTTETAARDFYVVLHGKKA